MVSDRLKKDSLPLGGAGQAIINRRILTPNDLDANKRLCEAFSEG